MDNKLDDDVEISTNELKELNSILLSKYASILSKMAGQEKKELVDQKLKELSETIAALSKEVPDKTFQEAKKNLELIRQILTTSAITVKKIA